MFLGTNNLLFKCILFGAEIIRRKRRKENYKNLAEEIMTAD